MEIMGKNLWKGIIMAHIFGMEKFGPQIVQSGNRVGADASQTLFLPHFDTYFKIITCKWLNDRNICIKVCYPHNWFAIGQSRILLSYHMSYALDDVFQMEQRCHSAILLAKMKTDGAKLNNVCQAANIPTCVLHIWTIWIMTPLWPNIAKRCWMIT